jgi:hypothetical protein
MPTNHRNRFFLDALIHHPDQRTYHSHENNRFVFKWNKSSPGIIGCLKP